MYRHTKGHSRTRRHKNGDTPDPAMGCVVAGRGGRVSGRRAARVCHGGLEHRSTRDNPERASDLSGTGSESLPCRQSTRLSPEVLSAGPTPRHLRAGGRQHTAAGGRDRAGGERTGRRWTRIRAAARLDGPRTSWRAPGRGPLTPATRPTWGGARPPIVDDDELGRPRSNPRAAGRGSAITRWSSVARLTGAHPDPTVVQSAP